MCWLADGSNVVALRYKPLFPCVCVVDRELFRRLSAARMRETNPKCQVVADIRGDGTAPAVDVVFGECHMHYKPPLWCVGLSGV